jgi:Fic family protein
MRIPEKSPSDAELMKEHSEQMTELITAYSGKTEKSDEIHNLVRKYNDEEYIHWDQLRRKKIPYEAKSIWWLLKLLRTGKFRRLKIGNKNLYFIVLDKFLKQLHIIDKSSPSSFDSLFGTSPREGSKHQYLINSLMEEAIASSQLEGAATTRQVAKKFLREGKKPKNTSEKMVLNNFLTISKLKEIKDKPLTKELILEIHREICNGTLDDVSDEINFRTTNDIVVQDKRDATPIYYPPDVTEIPAMLEGVCDFANKNDEFVHPIIKAIILHFLIGFIHPFNDGNGRTARALFYWYALKNRYDLFEYLSISRIFIHSPSQYTTAYLYSETDNNDLTYFIDFNIEIISKAMDDLRKYIENESLEEKEAFRIFTETPGLTVRQAEILTDFIKNSMNHFTIGEIAGKYRLSIPTARNDLLALESKGKVKKYRDGKKLVFMLPNKPREKVI